MTTQVVVKHCFWSHQGYQLQSPPEYRFYREFSNVDEAVFSPTPQCRLIGHLVRVSYLARSGGNANHRLFSGRTIDAAPFFLSLISSCTCLDLELPGLYEFTPPLIDGINTTWALFPWKFSLGDRNCKGNNCSHRSKILRNMRPLHRSGVAQFSLVYDFK